jgi:hypothetical protein
MKKTLAALATLLLLTACGGGGGRPSVDDIASALKDKDNPANLSDAGASDEAIDCVAKAFHDSDLSDDALQALVDGDEDYEGSGDDKDVMESGDLQGEITKCITG